MECGDRHGPGSVDMNERKGVGGYSIYVYLSMRTEESSGPCLNEACILRVSVITRIDHQMVPKS